MPLSVVVTGASGFLGSRVACAVEARSGVEVIRVSRREIHGGRRVKDYSESPGGDVLIHLAEESDRTRAGRDGEEYEERSRSTLLTLLAKDYPRVIYASSGVLYGDSEARPHTPNDPLQISDAYSRTKRHSELSVLESATGIAIRVANLYGPGMSHRNVMSTILRQIPGTGPVIVMDTAPVRDFLWVDDAAEGFASLALMEKGNPGGVLNLGTRIGTSIGDLARMILRLAGEPHRRVVAAHPTGVDSSLVLDYSDVTKLCGWEPSTSLAAGAAQLLNRATVKT